MLIVYRKSYSPRRSRIICSSREPEPQREYHIPLSQIPDLPDFSLDPFLSLYFSFIFPCHPFSLSPPLFPPLTASPFIPPPYFSLPTAPLSNHLLFRSFRHGFLSPLSPSFTFISFFKESYEVLVYIAQVQKVIAGLLYSGKKDSISGISYILYFATSSFPASFIKCQMFFYRLLGYRHKKKVKSLSHVINLK
jgi:hypothetical protein